MFNDRSNNYDFKKLDQNARTQILVKDEESLNNMTDAQKKLFAQSSHKPSVDKNILSKKHDLDVSNLPSSKYLQTFNTNMTIEEAEQLAKAQDEQETVLQTPTVKEEVQATKQDHDIEPSVDFDNLIEQANSIKIDEKLIKNELKNSTPAPKKNYSFRIKLVAGVYCILVALFGGWVIGNAIDISHTNANIYQTIEENEELNVAIEQIIGKIKNFDSASKDPEESGVLKEMGSEIINVIPEEIIEPNQYVDQSNWFDALCNWLAKLFGAK